MPPFIHRLLLVVAVTLGSLTTTYGADGLRVAWTNGHLTVTSPRLPGGTLDILYLEAFCHRGSTDRDWGRTTLPHKTRLLEASSNGRHLKFLTTVEPQVTVRHEIRAGDDELDIRFELTNAADQDVDLEWFQPACIRVDRFTGTNQVGYTRRSFLFTDAGLTRLTDTRRREAARYLGGQVYVPAEINLADVNPRPISRDQPVNGLLACWSADDRWILATASDRTHELFEGVYVCLHSDPHVGGLKAHETKKVRSKIYVVKNDVDALLKRYRKDFGL